MRYQWVSRLSGIVLAGLSGAAFAFTENILYYGRVYRYAARTFGRCSAGGITEQLFVMRGVITCFGHPLYRNDWSRPQESRPLQEQDRLVVAPLAGYCIAVFLHMAFNTTATLVQAAACSSSILAWRCRSSSA